MIDLVSYPVFIVTQSRYNIIWIHLFHNLKPGEYFMGNMKNSLLIFCFCLFVFMVSCNHYVNDAGKAEQVFGKETINKYKDYDRV